MKNKKMLLLIIVLILAIVLITVGVLFLPEDKKQEEVVYSAINKYMYATFDDTLYEEDNIGSVHLTEIKQGTEINVIECNNVGWCKVTIDDDEGYMQRNLLVEEPVTPVEEEPIEEEPIEETPLPETNTEMTPVNDKMYASTEVNVRSSMDYGDNIVGVLKYNEEVTRIGTIDKWSVINYNGATCYVITSVLMKNKIERKPIDTNVKQDGSIDPSKPMVALTFDDGPGPATNRILDTLEKYNAKATFFDIGNRVYNYKDTVIRESQLGEVGTHTYSHKNLNAISLDVLNSEINSGKQSIKDVLGYEPKLIRPPYGNANNTVKAAITDMAIINWNIDTLDWKSRNSEMIINKVLQAGNLDGDIILMHGIYDSTADAVEYLVPYLINEGYQIVTISELASYKGVELTTGYIYYHF